MWMVPVSWEINIRHFFNRPAACATVVLPHIFKALPRKGNKPSRTAPYPRRPRPARSYTLPRSADRTTPQNAPPAMPSRSCSPRDLKPPGLLLSPPPRSLCRQRYAAADRTGAALIQVEEMNPVFVPEAVDEGHQVNIPQIEKKPPPIRRHHAAVFFRRVQLRVEP